jgi:hypothetical protein
MPDLDDSLRAEVERMARQVQVGTDVLPKVVRRVRRRRRMRTVQTGALIAAVLVGTALGTLGLERIFGQHTTPAAGPTSARIATASIRSDLQVVVTAQRSSAQTAATTVRVSALVSHGSSWRPAGAAVLGRRSGWHWDAVSGPGGVCQLVVAEIPGGIRVELRLAQRVASPDGGGNACSAPQVTVLRDGEIVSP